MPTSSGSLSPVTAVDAELLSMALAELNVDDLGAIGADGGQKDVRKVKRNGRDLIMKVISIAASSPDVLRRAEREVDLLRSIGSANVVRVESGLVELDEPVRGAAWLEEYLDGEDLTATLLNGKWTWSETEAMGAQVANGLAAGHRLEVVHRDLSSNNVRKLSDGSYKVLDFGFARHTLRSGLTVAGQPGTPGFCSPEHLNSYSGAPMPASDVFCVGILMYAALSGVMPIPYTGDDSDYISRLSRVAVQDLAELRSDLRPEHLAIVRRCMHPQPARRYRDGKSLAEALESVSK